MQLKNITAVLFASVGLATAASAQIVLNEIRLDEPSADLNEYFELAGAPGASLNGYSLIVIGDGTGGSGVVENITSLDGFSIPADGYFLAATATFGTGGVPVAGSVDMTTTFAFENSDNVTYLLVSGFTGASGDDLDGNDDGILDSTPWASILDSVGIVESNPPVGTELLYSSTLVGPDGGFAPGHVYRFPNGTGAWAIGAFDGGQDTPGSANVPAPGAAALMGLGGLMLARRRR